MLCNTKLVQVKDPKGKRLEINYPLDITEDLRAVSKG